MVDGDPEKSRSSPICLGSNISKTAGVEMLFSNNRQLLESLLLFLTAWLLVKILSPPVHNLKEICSEAINKHPTAPSLLSLPSFPLLRREGKGGEEGLGVD